MYYILHDKLYPKSWHTILIKEVFENHIEASIRLQELEKMLDCINIEIGYIKQEPVNDK